MATAELLVSAVQARGSDASDARDAAHEATHALEWSVSKKWTRDNIHARKPRRVSDGLASEILARAVEAIVCARFSIPYDIKHWAMVCWMEMLKNERIRLPHGSFLENAIGMRMKSKATIAMADRVLALVGEQHVEDTLPKKPRRRR